MKNSIMRLWAQCITPTDTINVAAHLSITAVATTVNVFSYYVLRDEHRIQHIPDDAERLLYEL